MNETGYAAARQLHAQRIAQGWKPAGRKIGFTNRSIWPRYGVFEPIWGTVYDRTLIFAQGERASISLAGLPNPRIEPEICFKLAVAPRSREPEAVLAAVEWVAHCFEIVQCTRADWKTTLDEATAANGMHALLVVGTPVAAGEVPELAALLPKLQLVLSCNGAERDRGVGAMALDSPLLALGHLVAVLASQPASAPLEAGEIITTGTLTDAHAIKAGEIWSTSLAGFPLRGLTAEFT